MKKTHPVKDGNLVEGGNQEPIDHKYLPSIKPEDKSRLSGSLESGPARKSVPAQGVPRFICGVCSTCGDMFKLSSGKSCLKHSQTCVTLQW